MQAGAVLASLEVAHRLVVHTEREASSRREMPRSAAQLAIRL